MFFFVCPERPRTQRFVQATPSNYPSHLQPRWSVVAGGRVSVLVWGMGRTTTTPGSGQQWSLEIEIERDDGEGNKPRREREKASTRPGRGTRETQLTGPLPCPSGTWEADLYGVKLIPGGSHQAAGSGVWSSLIPSGRGGFGCAVPRLRRRGRVRQLGGSVLSKTGHAPFPGGWAHSLPMVS